MPSISIEDYCRRLLVRLTLYICTRLFEKASPPFLADTLKSFFFRGRMFAGHPPPAATDLALCCGTSEESADRFWPEMSHKIEKKK